MQITFHDFVKIVHFRNTRSEYLLKIDILFLLLFGVLVSVLIYLFPVNGVFVIFYPYTGLWKIMINFFPTISFSSLPIFHVSGRNRC